MFPMPELGPKAIHEKQESWKAHPFPTRITCAGSNRGNRHAVQNKMEQHIPHQIALAPPTLVNSGTAIAKPTAR